MNTQNFNSVLEDQINLCKDVLVSKAKEYATDVDRLRNFKVAAVLENCTNHKALSGMMTKHTVSIYDMCGSDKEFKMEAWNEKITDHINYLILLKAVLIEESSSEPIDTPKPDMTLSAYMSQPQTIPTEDFYTGTNQ